MSAETIPAVFARARWVREYSAAIWAPRYLKHGYAAYDLEDGGMLAPLRDRVRAAFQDERNLVPELYSTTNAYLNGVAMPADWLTRPPDPELPLEGQQSTFTVHGKGIGEAVEKLHRSLHPFVEEVIGQPLERSDHYGPRLYRDGSVLIGHLDAYPEHVISVSVTVQCDRPWDLQLFDLSIANESMETHQVRTHEDNLVIYEGCRVLHARMTPYEGEGFVGVYLHYVPRDFSTGRRGGYHSVEGEGGMHGRRVDGKGAAAPV